MHDGRVSNRFQGAPSGYEKLWSCKSATDLLYYHGDYGGTGTTNAACRRYSSIFCLSIALLNCQVCANTIYITPSTLTRVLWVAIGVHDAMN